jgi:hypothetical protein
MTPAAKYVGRTPDTDAVIVPKSFADTTVTQLEPTPAYVTAQINAAITANTLETQAYIDGVNANLAHKSAVDAADASYVPATTINAPNGIAGLDASGSIMTGQLPAGVATDDVIAVYDVYTAGTIILAGSHTVATANLREYQIASITIPDPGYAWRPIPLGWVQGGDVTALAPPSRLQGTGNYGMLAVMDASGVSNQVHGVGICTDSYFYRQYPVLPYAAPSQTALSVAPLIGGATLGLYASVYSGRSYTFTNTGLVYQIFCFPAV